MMDSWRVYNLQEQKQEEERKMLFAELRANNTGNALLIVLGVYDLIVPSCERAFHCKSD